jgi:hypothetical protein
MDMIRLETHPETAVAVTFQPGDATRYQFVASLDGDNWHLYTRFPGYTNTPVIIVEPWQLETMRRDFAYVLAAGTDDYRNKVCDCPGLLQTCKGWGPEGVNPWTVLAAVVVAHEMEVRTNNMQRLG